MSSNKARATAISPAALGFSAPEAAKPKMSAGAIGQAGSKEALRRLDAAMAELKTMAAMPLLHRAVQALQADDFHKGAELAIAALQQDESNGYGWYLLGIARERVGDFKSSIQAYEAAIGRLPDPAMAANDLGRLAYRMGMKPVAEQLFRRFLEVHPGVSEVVNNLACALRDQGRFSEAIEVLRPAILADQGDWMLWNTMGTIVGEQGDPAASETFFDEAVRLGGKAAFKALYNRGNARLALGALDGALEDCDAARTAPMAPNDAMMMQLARSTIQIAMGRIGEGFDDYEARLDPQFADCTHFLIDRPRWTPGDDLAGKTLAVMGEQGLGDEVLFASMLPDVLAALGPGGKLILAVEQRLVPLMQRSFPQAVVGAHTTGNLDGHTVRAAQFVSDWSAVDLWTPIGSLARGFRRSVDAFPQENVFLTPDPARIAYWRAELDRLGPAPKVGVLWKSLKLDAARFRYFSPFEQWARVLRTPGVQWVNLQYGESADEIAFARQQLGLDIWTPPGIDLKQDLDEVAALCAAMDLIIAPSNATTNLAAGAGAPVWLITTPGAWPRLGCDTTYPWYPQVRAFAPPAYGEWDAVMADVADALSGWVVSR